MEKGRQDDDVYVDYSSKFLYLIRIKRVISSMKHPENANYELIKF